MKTLQKIILGWMAPIILTGSGLATDARAGVRVNATLRTPGVEVRVGHPPYQRHYKYRARRLPARPFHYYTVDRHDWRVAGRLASITGVSTREMIQLRRYGYTWREIGRILRLPRGVTRAAMDHRSWKRFLREERLARHENRHRRGQRDVMYHLDEELYFDD
jgi:hypothetical protein